MRRVRAFFGGIHPKENKESTNSTPIQVLSAPEVVVVPLLQHAGREAKPLVAKGDEVLKGQPIAEADGRISARVHAP
ncbi:MAG: electron transport complex subunit RsxC, partial [Limnochordia bacterium]